VTAPKRVLIAAITHESHSFVPGNTSFDRFRISRDEQILAKADGASSIGGFIEVGKKHGWEIIPSVTYGANASATADHAVFEQFWSELEERINKAMAVKPLDAILLSLHGAMVTTESVDPEGELLARLRAKPGLETIPIVGSYDLHANFTQRMGQHASALVGYRHNPHTDTRETAVRAAEQLARMLETGVTPHMRVKHAPVIWSPPGTGTADRPMKDLEALARQIETENPDIWIVNVIGGYSFSDVPEAGVSFSLVTTGSDAVADAALDRLVALAVELRELGVVKEWDLDEAILAVKGKPGLHCIVEPADNIGGGAPGDCTPVLRAFLKHKLTNAAVAIADPESVKAFDGAKPGEVRRVRIGGKQSKMDEGPVEIDAKFVSRSDGKFVLEDKHSHGAGAGYNVDMGPCAVVTIGENDGITVLLSSLKRSPNDLAQWRSQGIVPENLSYVNLKGAIAWRQAWVKIMATSHTVVTGGPCTSDSTKLPYKRLRRPIYPLDQIPGV
jgi:microcystin degradation protein MlrC